MSVPGSLPRLSNKWNARSLILSCEAEISGAADLLAGRF